MNAVKEVRFEEAVTVKRIVAVATAIMVTCLIGLGASTAHGGALSGWSSSFGAGISQSKATGRPLVLLIAREGCEACAQHQMQLARNGSAFRNAIRVRVEAAENPSLTSQYAGGGTPTTVVFAPGDYSSPVYTYTGVMDSSTIRQIGRSLDNISARAR